MIPKFFEKFNKDISWIKDNSIYIVRHGSHAYGTNIATSDEDFRGICIPPKSYFLGSKDRFEQAELHDPDAVIYEIRKFFNLAAACNPNVLETLFVDPIDVLHVDPLGQKILDNREKFLSKRIKHTLSGYAFSQLKRIKGHRKWVLNPPKAPPSRAEMGLPEQTLIPQDQLMAASAEVQKEIDRFQFNFMEELSEPMKISVTSAMSEMLGELKITSDQHWMAAARKVGLSDNFIEIMQLERGYTTKKREFEQFQEWKLNRNKKRFADEEKFGFDLKYALHLVRLIKVCREVLTTGKLIVKRPDAKQLLEIREGKWTYDQVVEFAEKEEVELQKLYNECTLLPKLPDFTFLDNLCIEIVESKIL